MSDSNSSNSVVILWVYDDFSGPSNGLALYNGEKVWFSRVAKTDDNDRSYELRQLSPEILTLVEENHVEFCKSSGAPFKHGDPMRIKRRATMQRMDFKTSIPEGEKGIEVKPRGLAATNLFKHRHTSDIEGKLIATIKETQFSNYLVPRTVEFY